MGFIVRISVLCDYLENYWENRASFRIRYQTALAMAQRGHNVIFIFPRSDYKYTRADVNAGSMGGSLTVIGTPGILPPRLRTGGFNVVDTCFKLLYVMTHSIDIIHVVSGHRPSNFLPSIFAKFLKRVAIVDECWEWLGEGGHADRRRGLLGKTISFYDRLLEIRLTELYDGIIAISSELKKRFRSQEKVIVLHGGSESAQLICYTKDNAREYLKIPKHWLIAGMSNLIHSDHNDNIAFFEALRCLCKEFVDLHLIATGSDNQYIRKIEEEFELSGRIIFPGYVDFETYNRFLSACDLFVLPFPDTKINKGRWPNKIGDYISLERPVITNFTGDIGNLFKTYRLGLVCEDTPESFIQAFRSIVDNTSGPTTFCDDARHVSENILSFDKRIEQMLSIFEMTLAAKRS